MSRLRHSVSPNGGRAPSFERHRDCKQRGEWSSEWSSDLHGPWHALYAILPSCRWSSWERLSVWQHKDTKADRNCRVLCVCGKTYFKHRARQKISRCPCTPKRGRTHHVVANGHHVISTVKVPLYLCKTCNDSTSSGVSATIKRATKKHRELVERVDHITVVWRVLHVREQCQMTYNVLTCILNREQGRHNVCRRGLTRVRHKCAWLLDKQGSKLAWHCFTLNRADAQNNLRPRDLHKSQRKATPTEVNSNTNQQQNWQISAATEINSNRNQEQQKSTATESNCNNKQQWRNSKKDINRNRHQQRTALAVPLVAPRSVSVSPRSVLMTPWRCPFLAVAVDFRCCRFLFLLICPIVDVCCSRFLLLFIFWGEVKGCDRGKSFEVKTVSQNRRAGHCLKPGVWDELFETMLAGQIVWNQTYDAHYLKPSSRSNSFWIFLEMHGYYLIFNYILL